MASIFQNSTGSMWRAGGRVGSEGRGGLEGAMEQTLIYSRVATREHFFYRSPKLQIRKESHVISVFGGVFGSNMIKHTAAH